MMLAVFFTQTPFFKHTADSMGVGVGRCQGKVAGTQEGGRERATLSDCIKHGVHVTCAGTAALQHLSVWVAGRL